MHIQQGSPYIPHPINQQNNQYVVLLTFQKVFQLGNPPLNLRDSLLSDHCNNHLVNPLEHRLESRLIYLAAYRHASRRNNLSFIPLDNP